MKVEEVRTKLTELVKKSRCIRRMIGAFVTDSDGNVIGEGYNGTPSCMKSCQDSPCPDALIPAGAGVAKYCYGVHAEMRALLDMMKKSIPLDRIHAFYSTKQPCLHCVLVLMETPCKEIYYLVPSNDPVGGELWEKVGRKIKQIPDGSALCQ